jgi:soluble lytic murein transglycosylase-like protein
MARTTPPPPAALQGNAWAIGTAGITPSLPLIIAGYNGEADAVTRWIAAWPEPPPADLFAENISYTETRKYVQRVLGFLQTYRYVYGD